MAQVQKVRDAIGDEGLRIAADTLVTLAQVGSEPEDRVRFDAAQTILGYFTFYGDGEVGDPEPEAAG